jgi:hypothetical protein
MERYIIFDPQLTKADSLVLKSLTSDLEEHESLAASGGIAVRAESGVSTSTSKERDAAMLATMRALNDPKDERFEPTVINSVDKVELPSFLNDWILQPYIRLARSIVRVETDVVFITHLLLYFTTSVPSAIFLFYHFTYLHGILHAAMQVYYIGTYTLMRHQHIHQRGILKKRYAVFDQLFPYITDPLMGHTWNSYYYHHVKHHHIEANGPDDLSSTIRYQRDEILHLLHYCGRFLTLIWLELPLYFIRTNRTSLGLKAGGWETASYLFQYTAYRFNPRAATFALLIPFALLRLGLMVGNWGQHALVDPDMPDSDYRSSITLIDTQSNRHCFNDGYHTSHHLNPLRHWREHPVSFLESKKVYADQHALVFHGIDYIMITVRLMMKDYAYLAERMVPIGAQMGMSMEERMGLLRSCTRKFSEEEIERKFKRR